MSAEEGSGVAVMATGVRGGKPGLPGVWLGSCSSPFCFLIGRGSSALGIDLPLCCRSTDTERRPEDLHEK